jgi:hypothetical protein
MSPLGLGLLLLVMLTSVASAKPKIAILGLEVIGSLDPEQVKIAKSLTNGLRERASAGTGPYELAPNSDKELVDEKLMNNCGTEALVCMAPIGLAMRADFLMWGKIEKVDKGYHVTIKLMRIATKLPMPTFSEIVSVSDIKNDPKGVAKRAYSMMTATDEGTVTVRVATVERATVYIDDQPKGTTTSGVLTIQVPEGKHRLAVVATEKGWQRYEEELSINAGDQRNIPVELTRADPGGTTVKPPDPKSQPGGGAVGVGGGAVGVGAGGGASGPPRDTMGVSGGGGGGSGGSGWRTVAIGATVLAVASAGGFAWSWWELSKAGKVEGVAGVDTGPFAYSCLTTDTRDVCDSAGMYRNISVGTAVVAGAMTGLAAFAFYKSSSAKEQRRLANGRSTRPRRELTVTPVMSASGGGATLRFDW